jgi:hypothetical protein
MYQALSGKLGIGKIDSPAGILFDKHPPPVQV